MNPHRYANPSKAAWEATADIHAQRSREIVRERQDILKALKAGPLAAMEISAVTGIHSGVVSGHLQRLRR